MTEELSINDFLKKAIALGASDEHMIVGQPPFVRVNGFMKKVVLPQVTRAGLTNMLLNIAPQNIAQQFNTDKDADVWKYSIVSGDATATIDGTDLLN